MAALRFYNRVNPAVFLVLEPEETVVKWALRVFWGYWKTLN